MKYTTLLCLETVMAAKCSSGVSMTTDHMVHMRSHKGHRHAYAHHRKSAVELLEASKGEYVKSRQVLNQRQELKHPENLSVSSEPLALLSIQARHIAIDDVADTLSTSPKRKVSVEHVKSTWTETKQRCPSPDREGKPIEPESPTSKEGDDHPATFKKPVTPPKLPPKPAVPPRPSTKPATSPVPGPKPAALLRLDSTGRPIPPPRPSRSSLDQTDSSSNMSSIKTDKTSASVATTVNNSASPDFIPKRYSSLSAHATVDAGKDTGDRDSFSDSNGHCSGRNREARSSLSSQSEGILKPLCTTSLSTSVGVLLEQERSPVPKPRAERQLKEAEPPQRRHLHRSHSDLSSCRHSRASSDFSDLSSRLSRTSTEVERFFNEMGIDRTVLEPMRKLAESKHKDNVLGSFSSLGSVSGQSFASRLSQNELDKPGMDSEHDLMERSGASGTTSVVERNARIIKWLCNVKKARTAPGKVKSKAPVTSTSS